MQRCVVSSALATRVPNQFLEVCIADLNPEIDFERVSVLFKCAVGVAMAQALLNQREPWVYCQLMLFGELYERLC